MIEKIKNKNDVEYSRPEISVITISISDYILAESDSMLENPTEGDDWGWD